MLAKISQWILGAFGWKIEGEIPSDIKKMVIAVIPHTSNWDFPLGLLVRTAMKEKISYIGKSSLFVFPVGILFKALGGIPVDRSKSNNFVDAVVEVFRKAPELRIAIAPEGTRKTVQRLKTGFYYIAKGAGVPILLTKFDFEKKVVDFGEIFWPTEDPKADFEYIHQYFKGIRGKNAVFNLSA
jgi:1-acyl-sn-glycerol-3-phosphate acyltransferase